MDSTTAIEKTGTAGDSISETLDTPLHRTRGNDRKYQLSKEISSFAEGVRDSMKRRGYNISLLQDGRDSRSRYISQSINVPPTSTLCDITDRFENPRKAPLPQGLKYNTQNLKCPSTTVNIRGKRYPVALINARSESHRTQPFTSIHILPSKI
jgi:hypothetical protein